MSVREVSDVSERVSECMRARASYAPSYLSQCTSTALLTREVYIAGAGGTHIIGRGPSAETTAERGKSLATSICAMVCMFQRAGT